MPTYLVITGNHTSCKTPLEYVDHIIYGDPTDLRAIEVGGRFVALVTYGDGDENTALYTATRMGSFPHGAKAFDTEDDALTEFGRWASHWAPTKPRPAEEVEGERNLAREALEHHLRHH